MSKFYVKHRLLVDSLETETPLAATAEIQQVNAIAKEVDDRLEFLSREPDSPNTRQAQSDARRLAIEKVDALRAGALSRWERHRDASREKLLARPEPADRSRNESLWNGIAAAGADTTMVSVSRHSFPAELKTVFLTMPPSVQKNGNGMLEVRELVNSLTPAVRRGGLAGSGRAPPFPLRFCDILPLWLEETRDAPECMRNSLRARRRSERAFKRDGGV